MISKPSFTAIQTPLRGIQSVNIYDRLVTRRISEMVVVPSRTLR
jgi:hypothetical protein